MIKTAGICPNVSKCMQFQMKWFIIQIGLKLFEVTQNWIKIRFHLARSWTELLLFVQNWF